MLVYVSSAGIPSRRAHGYQIVKMCEAFAKTGMDVQLVLPDPPMDNQGTQDDPNGFIQYAVRTSFPVIRLTLWPFLRPFVRWLKSFYSAAPNVIDQLLYAVNVLAYLRRTVRVPDSILYVREEILLCALVFCPWRRYRVVHEVHRLPVRSRWLFNHMLERVDLIVSVTGAMRQELVKSSRRTLPIIVEHDGVDLETFDIALSREDARKQLGLPLDGWFAGYTGSFNSIGGDKGISLVLGAAERLLPFFPRLYFLLIGGDEGSVQRYQHECRERGLSADRVQLMGRKPSSEIPVWLKACNLLLIPSPRTEFFDRYTSPLKLFEYMASGRPIALSRLASVQEVLAEDEALYFEPGDVGDLVAQLTSGLNDPALMDRLSQRMRARKGDHSWVGRARRILDALQKETARGIDA